VAAYVIAMVDVHDPEGYEEYRRRVPATIEAHGGRFVARGGQTEALEGSLPAGRLVILEFPDVEAARGWYDSPEYREILAIRERYSTGTILLTAGVETA
jgi:uncharacterized protein (DUF1330 family)